MATTVASSASFDDIMFIDIYKQLNYDTVEEAARNILEGKCQT